MAKTKLLFSTPLYHANLAESGNFDMGELEKSCWSIAQDDEAGQKWCDENNYPGYTSYASLSDLTWRSPFFEELKNLLDLHVKTFVEELDFDLEGRNLKLEDLWINILPEGGNHSAHIHPNSVISGTTYISMPSGSSAIKFEDPRHSMMMAAPSRIKDAKEYLKPFIYVNPSVGDVLLWESWLRHEVPANNSSEERISISFNYSW
ncbi:MAG: TIGR02466 family protein [Paracoccaceae bacterium]